MEPNQIYLVTVLSFNLFETKKPLQNRLLLVLTITKSKRFINFDMVKSYSNFCYL